MDVWLVHLDRVDAPSLKRWFDWLTPDEQLKHGRFVTPQLSREYLVTRALSRWALSRYLPDVSPPDWRFDRTEAGRPFVVGPRQAPHFNLSNADGLVACAVSATHPVGVDVEPIARGHELLANAHRLFSDLENADVRALADDLRAEHTVALWTLKEAYLKARGEGIAVHMNRFSVRPGAPPPLERATHSRKPTHSRRFVLAGDGLGDDPDAWQLEVSRVGGHDPGRDPATSEHLLALAIERGRSPDVSVSYGEGLGVAAA